jgi:hypothetical protein
MAAPLQQLLSVVKQGPPPTYNSLITSAAPVHRWKFLETSGNFASSVGTLTLVKSGTVTYSQTAMSASTGGGAVLLGSGAVLQSSGLGSLPVGGTARTFCCVFKPTATSAQQILFYGPNGFQTFNNLVINNGGAGIIMYDIGSTNYSPSGTGCNVLAWHLLIVRATGTGSKDFTIYLDSFSASTTVANSPNTTSSGGFLIGQNGLGANQGSYYIDDMAVFNRGLSDSEITAIKATLGF